MKERGHSPQALAMAACLKNARIPSHSTKNRWQSHAYVPPPLFQRISVVVTHYFKCRCMSRILLFLGDVTHKSATRHCLPLLTLMRSISAKPVGDNADIEGFQNASNAGLWMPRIEGGSIIRLKCHLPSSGKEIAELGVKFQELSRMANTKGNSLCKSPAIFIRPA